VLRRVTMARGVKTISAVAALALLAGVVVLSSPASAQNNLRVRVGQDLSDKAKAPADGDRFYAPPPLQVHAGDTITFNFKGFHTATLIPKNTGAKQWAADNAGFADDYSFVAVDPDEPGNQEQPALKFNNNAALPSDPTCGAEDNPCPYDGSSVVNSGVPFASPEFTVAINANAGDYFYVICLLHLKMKLRVEVVADTADTTTQAEINAYRTQKTNSDAARARKLDNKLRSERESHRENGKVVWEAYAGVDRKGFSLLGFYPKKLRIRKGQKVEWAFDQLVYEDHTVTFPKKRALAVAGSSGNPVCDPDGDDGPGPDNPPEIQGPPFCNDPTQVEFDIPRKFAYERGNHRHKRFDYDNSGIRGANVGDLSSYTLKFTKRSSRKGIGYICLIHPFMQARVVVGRH
jgi:plastocyanin